MGRTRLGKDYTVVIPAEAEESLKDVLGKPGKSERVLKKERRCLERFLKSSRAKLTPLKSKDGWELATCRYPFQGSGKRGGLRLIVVSNDEKVVIVDMYWRRDAYSLTNNDKKEYLSRALSEV